MKISSNLITGMISSKEGKLLQYDTLSAMLLDIRNTNAVLKSDKKVTVETTQEKSSYHISENKGRIRIKKTSENKQPFSIKTFWQSLKQIYIDWKECRNIKQQIARTTESTTLQK